MQGLRSASAPATWFAVAFSNVRSIPAMAMRRNWPRFFDWKTMYFDQENLSALMARSDLFVAHRFPYPTPRTLGYVLSRTSLSPVFAKIASGTGLATLSMTVPTGYHVAVYEPRVAEQRHEKLSIVLPVFNEARYAHSIIEAVLAKPLKIDREVIIV